LTPELSVIFVNWNGGGLLRRAVESVERFAPSLPFEIVVVDNASTDGSRDWLRSLGQRVRLVENEENLGFSKANNQGIRTSRAPFVFLLNTDAEVRAGTIDKLIETLRSDGRAGACAPRLVNPDGTLQPSVWRNPPTAWETLLSGLKLYRLIPRRARGRLLLGTFWDHSERRRVPMLPGTALLVRRRTIEDVGALDEGFHMYFEDVEWSLRMVRGGWHLVFEPAAVVMHHGGQSALLRWGAGERWRVQLEASLKFQRQCLPAWQVKANMLANCAVLLFERASRKLHGRPADDVVAALEIYRDHFTRAPARR
jgi:GT2 family glycosyltransferase